MGGTMKQVRLEERWNGPRHGWCAVALRACVAAAAGVWLVGCGGQTSVSCGTGTHLSGDSCVVDDDAGRDGGARPGHEAGKGADAGAPRDAAKDGTTKVKDGGSGRPDGAPTDAGVGDAADAGGGDASEAGTPVSCGDVNACLASDGGAGPVDLGRIDTCSIGSGPNLMGTSSQWFTAYFTNGPPSCQELSVEVSSEPGALFDVEVYEGDAGTPQVSCPPLVASAFSSIADCNCDACCNPDGLALVMVPNPGQVYIHVVAHGGAGCSTGQPWDLLVTSE
jgi:hypothetical protein